MKSKTEENDFYIRLGYLIRIARTKAKKSQESLAQYLGLSRVTIVNIEKGRQKILIHDLVLTANFLNVALTELIPATFESPSKTLEKSLLEKINKNFKPTDKQAVKVEDFIKITLSNFSDKDDKRKEN